MNTNQYAKEFVKQHGAQGDLLGTAATYISLAAQRLEQPHPDTKRIANDLHEATSILVETDQTYRLEMRDGT